MTSTWKRRELPSLIWFSELFTSYLTPREDVSMLELGAVDGLDFTNTRDAYKCLPFSITPRLNIVGIALCAFGTGPCYPFNTLMLEIQWHLMLHLSSYCAFFACFLLRFHLPFFLRDFQNHWSWEVASSWSLRKEDGVLDFFSGPSSASFRMFSFNWLWLYYLLNVSN